MVTLMTDIVEKREKLFLFDTETGELVRKMDFNAPGHTKLAYFMHCAGDTLIVSDLGRIEICNGFSYRRIR